MSIESQRLKQLLTLCSAFGTRSSKGQGLISGIGPQGWNSTSIQTTYAGSTGYHTTFESKWSNTAYPLTIQQRLRVRNNDWIFATVDGILVSWPNNYYGPTPMTIRSETSQLREFDYKSIRLQLIKLKPFIAYTSHSTSPHLTIALPTSRSGILEPAPEVSIHSTMLPIYPWATDFSPLLRPSKTSLAAPSSSKLPLSSTAANSASLIEPVAHSRLPKSSSTSASSALPRQISSLTPAFPNITAMTTASRSSQRPDDCSEISPTFTVTVSPLFPPLYPMISTDRPKFDDLPYFSTSTDPDPNTIPPIFNPYRSLYWYNQFGYVPPPSDPYAPHSPPQLAVYRASLSPSSSAPDTPDSSAELPGELGAGPFAPSPAHHFDAHSAYIGCGSGGHVGCRLTIRGYIFGSAGQQIESVRQTVSVLPCPRAQECPLAHIRFTPGLFTGLVGLRIRATVRGQEVDWWMDDLVLSWSDGGCGAQAARAALGG